MTLTEPVACRWKGVCPAADPPASDPVTVRQTPAQPVTQSRAKQHTAEGFFISQLLH